MKQGFKRLFLVCIDRARQLDVVIIKTRRRRFAIHNGAVLERRRNGERKFLDFDLFGLRIEAFGQRDIFLSYGQHRGEGVVVRVEDRAAALERKHKIARARRVHIRARSFIIRPVLVGGVDVVAAVAVRIERERRAAVVKVLGNRPNDIAVRQRIGRNGEGRLGRGTRVALLRRFGDAHHNAVIPGVFRNFFGHRAEGIVAVRFRARDCRPVHKRAVARIALTFQAIEEIGDRHALFKGCR